MTSWTRFAVLFGLVCGVGLSAQALAETRFVCTSGSAERIIEVVYQNAPQQIPCEVQYTKGERVESLWRSSNQPGFCEARAQEFAQKQEGWGWQCSTAVSSEPREKVMQEETSGE